MIIIAKKPSLLEKITKLIDQYDDEKDENIEEYEDEEDDDAEPFMIRMTKSYNFLVDAIEMMPISSSKEYKFIKDKNKAKTLYLKITGLTKDYHDLLLRMKINIGE